jgi:hypothetical protein
VDNWNNLTNSQNRVRKKSFGGTFCFSNCHIIRLDTGGLVFLVSAINQSSTSRDEDDAKDDDDVINRTLLSTTSSSTGFDTKRATASFGFSCSAKQ